MKKIIFIALLLFSQLALSFWDSELDEIGETLLLSDIEKEDLKSFKERLNKSKSSRTRGSIEKGFGHYLLGYVISKENRPTKKSKNLSSDD